MAPAIVVKTYGCQMNEADSLALEEELQRMGFELVEDESKADAVILNTCAVRRKAEERVFGQLGHLKALKARSKALKARSKSSDGPLVLGLIGCMAKASKEEILSRAPFVDFILDPDQLEEVAPTLASYFPSLVFDGDASRGGDASRDGLPSLPFPFKRYLPIMRGCDNFCSYCIVPYTRGREVSTPPGKVIQRVEELQREGVLELTLLGQNVNSYSSQAWNFPMLLLELSRRFPEMGFRFLTSHPKDFSDELIEIMASRDNVLPSLHLPLQSGSDKILGLMKRRYTIKDYMTKIYRLREAIPDIALTTDLICGFPGEEKEDFQQTLAAVEEIRFSSAFMFYYQERPGTDAAEFPNMLAIEERKARLRSLIEVQQRVSEAQSQIYQGELIDTLVEQPSRRDEKVLAGRTVHDKIILFAGDQDLIGKRVKIRCTKADPWTLHGELVNA